MKIVIVSDRVYPFFKGGAEKRYWEIARGLTRKGHEIHFFTGQWPGMEKKMEINGMYLHGVYKVNNFYVNGKKSISESIKYTLRLLPYLMKENYDLIDCEQFPVFPIFISKLVASIRRKPLVVTWHEVWDLSNWQSYLGWKGILGYITEKLSLLMPSKIISVSNHTTQKLKNFLILKKEIYTVQNGVSVDGIFKVNPSTEKSNIIFVGRLLSHKNVDVLIKSIKLIKEKYPKTKCSIIGEGPEKEKLEDLTKKLNLEKNIKFLGSLENHDDVYALIKSSGCLILPSTREGFGIAVLEANACGIPVITIDHQDNGAKDLIRAGKNGFVCRLDEKEIAERIIKVLKNGLNKKMKQACINSAKKYDWGRIVNKTEEVYLR